MQLDRWFETVAQQQYTRKLLFSTLFERMTQVVLRKSGSIRAAEALCQGTRTQNSTQACGQADVRSAKAARGEQCPGVIETGAEAIWLWSAMEKMAAQGNLHRLLLVIRFKPRLRAQHLVLQQQRHDRESTATSVRPVADRWSRASSAVSVSEEIAYFLRNRVVWRS